MTDAVIQKSFNSGEWAPQLYGRVDQEKYKSGAALIENFFVDYRGGISTRTGMKYVLRCKDSTNVVRLIPFQASFSVGFIMEFGEGYIRFHRNGAPVLETAIALTGATAASPAVFTKNAHGLQDGDWVYCSGFTGGTWDTHLNGQYCIVASSATNTFQLTDLFGTAINSTGWGTWSAGSVARVYTLSSPYAADDLALLKFAQNVSTMILCHPSYSPYSLVYTSSTSWALSIIAFGATITAPTNFAVATTLSAGSVNYSYVATAVDANGQESAPCAAVALASTQDLRTTAGTNRCTWTAVSGAKFYNIYKAELSYTNAVGAGAAYGFIGFATGTIFDDSNIDPDFSLTPPIATNPFVGAGVDSATVTNQGTYTNPTVAPTATVAAPSSGQTATVQVVMGVIGTPTVNNGGLGWNVGDIVTGLSNNVRLVVKTVNPGGIITNVEAITFPGSDPGSLITTSAVPATVFSAGLENFSVSWGVRYVNVLAHGSGYTAAPAITFSGGAAAATAVLGAASAGNPAVPAFFQQRLVLANQPQSPQSFNMSKPGSTSYYNFDVSNPTNGGDAISGLLVSSVLNNIKAMIPQTSGLLTLSDGASWLINGGSAGAPVAPDAIAANAQSFVGANDVPPIIANADILYVQAKGSSVRNTTYNFYTNVWTGADISILSSHLFLGYQLTEWAWAEEPYKIVWAVRNDGVALSLTFMKEQEFVAWTHSNTNGEFKSVATIIEAMDVGYANSVYWVVERTIRSSTVKYIEMFPDRLMPNGVVDAWCVDSGIQYDGSPATSFTGGQHLGGETCTGLADGEVIPNFTMGTDGTFTLSSAASKVTVGLAFLPKLKTLPLDTGEPTIQGKPKKISEVKLKVAQTLGLTIGSSFDNQVPIKDLVVGEVSSMLAGQGSDQRVTDLVDGEAQIILDPTYTTPGQYCIEQPYPFPATILAVIPDIIVGDTKK